MTRTPVTSDDTLTWFVYDRFESWTESAEFSEDELARIERAQVEYDYCQELIRSRVSKHRAS